MAANVVLSSPLGIAQIVESEYRDIPCWAVYSLDYVTGHTVANAFKSALKSEVAAEVTTSTEVFAPLSATDVEAIY